ncbi:hypothetical protein F4825DRAFT_446937 [Nemania diffusa]|nr:hypothetical protein F4825DRAFT_446937 [Nemania diffusa]
MANTVEIRPLPAGADAEVANLATWLNSGEADFQTVDRIRICKNTDGLSSATSELSALFMGDIKACLILWRNYSNNPFDSRAFQDRLPDGHVKTRVTAIHFEDPTAVPLEPGWVMELIPILIDEGTVKVGDQQHTPNTYFHLTAQARVSGNFYGILLLSHIA